MARVAGTLVEGIFRASNKHICLAVLQILSLRLAVLQILGGQLQPPPQAQPLYDALNQMSAGRAGMAGQPAY